MIDKLKYIKILLPVLMLYGCSTPELAQQIYDSGFVAVINQPGYRQGAGPRVYIDEGHNNYHTMDGRYKPFADVLRQDGYQVFPYKGEFTRQSLIQVDILVISNPLHSSNLQSWSLPTPSAFTDEEIISINDWVKSGGSLLLIADHMPIPGAAEKLALSFGFRLLNGFAYGPDDNSFIRYSRDNGTLMEHVITRGQTKNELVLFVNTYTGHAFQIPRGAEPMFVLANGSYSLNPEQAFKFDKKTTRIDVSSWSQGAVRKYGKGRIALFGEAAAFTAQIAGAKKRKIGLNSPDAPYNLRFVLNVMHWLSGLLDNN